MISAGDFRKGVTFEMNGEPHVVLDFQHVKPGKGAAFVRTKYRNILTGATREEAFNPNDKFPKAHIETKTMQYLYNDGELYYFMDQETFDQVPLSADLVEDSLEKSCETTVNGCVILVVEASNKVVWVVAHAAEELVALTVGNTSQDSWVSNLVTVEVQDWENDTIGQWVHELVGLPRSCKWAGLCLAVADNSDCQQGWVVQDSAVSVGQGVAQLAALVDGTWSLRCVVGRNSAWVREAAEELLEALFIVGDEWVGLAICAVEQGLCGTCRSTVTRTHEEDGVLVMVADEAVDVAEQEVQAWGGSPVTNQAMLNVLARKTVLHKRVATKINLTNRQVVSCAPIPIDAGKLVLRYRLIQGLPRCTVHGLSHVLLLFLGCYLRVCAG